MQIITCAGYYRTGSSAISDFFSEFDNCKSFSDFEFRFIQDPDGISDLEYNIIDNPHRHNTSFAIKRFLKYAEFLSGNILMPRYSKFFGKKFMQFTKEYVDELTQLKAKTWWHRDQIERGEFFYFLDRLYSKINQLFNRNRSNISMLKNEVGYYTSIDKEQFYSATKLYISKIFSCVNKDNADFLMVDQLVPPTNIERYLNYFDNIKVIVVERDPRDLYILEKTKYKWGIIPYKNVEEFCEWYLITRSQKQSEDSQNVLHINFEDMVYKYQETKQKLLSFVDMSEINHVFSQTKFIPSDSIKNTRVYLNEIKYLKDIAYIEKKLSRYCYNFKTEN